MSDLDDWLTDPEPSGIPSVAAPQQTKTKIKLGRGGVIRNPATKRVTQTSNPLTNLRPPSKPGASAPTPEQELRADNPALAFPTIMTGMDMDADKGVRPALEDAPEPQNSKFNYKTTILELVQQAKRSGGKIGFGNEVFKITVEVKL